MYKFYYFYCIMIKLGKKESYYNRKLWKLYIKKKEILSTINISFQLFSTILTILIHLHVITFQCTYQYTRISYKFKINFKDNWKRISNWSFLNWLPLIQWIWRFFVNSSYRYQIDIRAASIHFFPRTTIKLW